MYVSLMMAVWAETCSSTEDYKQVCESEMIINKKLWNSCLALSCVHKCDHCQTDLFTALYQLLLIMLTCLNNRSVGYLMI
jgi:hypothetical protein